MKTLKVFKSIASVLLFSTILLSGLSGCQDDGRIEPEEETLQQVTEYQQQYQIPVDTIKTDTVVPYNFRTDTAYCYKDSRFNYRKFFQGRWRMYQRWYEYTGLHQTFTDQNTVCSFIFDGQYIKDCDWLIYVGSVKDSVSYGYQIFSNGEYLKIDGRRYKLFILDKDHFKIYRTKTYTNKGDEYIIYERFN